MYYDEMQRMHSYIKDCVRRLWHHLTEEEVNALEEYRDLFFMAVRKKHGIARAQAQIFLRDLEMQFREAA